MKKKEQKNTEKLTKGFRKHSRKRKRTEKIPSKETDACLNKIIVRKHINW